MTFSPLDDSWKQNWHRSTSPPLGLEQSDEHLIAEAGKYAKEQVDAEIVQARRDVETLLEEIVQEAVKNVDNAEVLEPWRKEWIDEYDRSSKTRIASERVVKRALRPLLEHLKAEKKGMTLAQNKAEVENEYRAWIVVASKEASWRKELDNDAPMLTRQAHAYGLVYLHSTKLHPHDHEAARQTLWVWLESIKTENLRYLEESKNKDVAGMQVKYEYARLTKLVADFRPPLFINHVTESVAPAYQLGEVLRRVKAWTVNETSHPLSRRMGRRAALIHSVAHSENRDEEVSF